MFLNYREQNFARIVNEAIAEDVERVTSSDVPTIIHHLQLIIELEKFGFPTREMLWDVVFHNTWPCLEFIGPPVLNCIVLPCAVYPTKSNNYLPLLDPLL